MIEIEDVEMKAGGSLSKEIREALAVLPLGKSFRCPLTMRAFVFRTAKEMGITVVTKKIKESLDEIRVGRVAGPQKTLIDYLR